MPTPCPVVFGRPRVSFFGISGIDLPIYSRYHESKPRGRVNFPLGSNPNQRYSPMAQAKRVHSTPRRTAPKIKPKTSAVLRVKKIGLDLVPDQGTPWQSRNDEKP